MAVWVIMRAFDALNLLPLPNRLALRKHSDCTVTNWRAGIA